MATKKITAKKLALDAAVREVKVCWTDLRQQFSSKEPVTAPAELQLIGQLLSTYHFMLGKLQGGVEGRMEAEAAARMEIAAAKKASAATRKKAGKAAAPAAAAKKAPARAPRGSKLLPYVDRHGVVIGATYRDPATKKEFTRGQLGNIPLWLRTAIAEGKSPTQFLVT